MDWLKESLEEAIELKRDFVAKNTAQMSDVAFIIVQSIMRGGKVLACGNGGSASDASHFVGEMLGRFRAERMSLPAVCLNSDPATVTAIANDYGYHKVFARQVTGLGNGADVLLAISTSGTSENVIRAVHAAKAKGIKTIALTGREGNFLSQMTDVALCVPGTCAARIQEVHIFIIHTICEMVDRSISQAMTSRLSAP